MSARDCLDCELIQESSVHCGSTIPWTGGPGLYKGAISMTMSLSKPESNVPLGFCFKFLFEFLP